MKDIWTVEYSVEQDCFHVETMDRLIQGNVMAMVDGRQLSYMLIDTTDSIENAHKLGDKYRELINHNRGISE